MESFFIMWVHLTAVAAWIGGMILVTFVVQPAMGRSGISQQEVKTLKRVEDGFRTIRWLAIIALLLTGFFNLLYEGASVRLESSWGAVLMVKILVAVIAMGLAGINDFIINSPAAKPVGNSALYSRWISHAVLFLTLVTLFLGVYLSRS